MVMRRARGYFERGSPCFIMTVKRTYVYIDAFNFYYGKVKGTKYKWLDFSRLCSILLPSNLHQILKIKYYTAEVKPRQNDNGPLNRQQNYIKALKTNPNFEVYYGHFLSHTVKMKLADSPGFANVIKTEEKGSDVNLATHMLYDACKNEYDVAVLISGDSDLLEPVRIIRNDFKKQVGYLNPQKNPSQVLKKNCDFMKDIRNSAIHNSQFPSEVYDLFGNVYRKPDEWI
ncbi:NYN domain protein [Leptospira weilii str. UI 13098]|uniref:NYN domain protein n=2 Tax=Leptospira weilii TaxID=28184 RepID=M6Q2C7_9LEPT|nr:NYN domain protein [Leptospira weilii str. UI 13098]